MSNIYPLDADNWEDAYWRRTDETRGLNDRIKELETFTTECSGFNCCPLAPELNAARERIALLEAVVNGLLPLIPAIENGHAIMATEYATLHRALRAAGYLKEANPAG